MTDVQLPLQHQNHQKGMNGKYSPKNLEIRGFSGSANANANQLVSVSESKANNSNTIGSATKKSLKLIEKSAPSTNFQVLRFNPNNEFGTLVSVIDVNPNLTNKTRTSFNTTSNSNNNKNSTTLLQNQLNSELIQINSAQSLNLLNSMNANLSASFLTANLMNTNNINTTNATTYNNNTNLTQSTQIATNATLHHATSTRNANQFWNDESNSGWTGTGVMSDRSSVYSIDDGDFDREASRKVNSQLREIEAILYEQNSTHSSQKSTECNEWLEKFPHLRILGKQIFRDECLLGENSSLIRSSLQSLQISSLKALSSNFTNVTSSISSNLSISSNNNNNNNKLELIASTSPNNDTNTNNNTSESKYFRRRENSDLSTQLLNVYGTSMSIRTVKEDDLNSSNDFTSFEEEIFDQEGIYEELLAYDNQEEEYLFEHNKRLNLSKRRRHGLPPITPKAAMKDLVLNFLFDHMWSELIDWSSDTIKAYAKTVSEDFIFVDDSTCKTPRLISTPNGLDENLFNNNTINLNVNANNLLDSNKSTSNTLNNSSPSYSSLNNPYPTNETINSSHINPTTISVNTSTSNHIINNNNNNTNNAIATTNVTKANIIQLKLFDSQLNQSNLYPIQSYTPNLLTRDNSYLYKNTNNLQNDTNNINNNDTLGDLMTKDLLQIKQLNRNGSNTNSANANINNNSNLKALNPIILGSQSRVSSGNRRQYQMNYYRKRYSSIEMGGMNTNASSAPVDKNIIIHGAGLAKPSSLNQNANEDAKSASNMPFTASGNALQMSTAITNSRSTTSTSQAYNHQMVNDENIYENDYNDYQPMYENGESSIDEINLINQNHPLNAKQLNVVSSLASHHGNHSHVNYFGFHQHNNANNFQPLPPIENSLTLKPIRISSANVNINSGLKQIKERSERPMTSTATRFDLNGIPTINKRSTTPSGLTSATKSALKKFNNTRQSPDDSIFLNNFLSTKSFNFLLNNNNNNNNSGTNITTSSNTTHNRRNSIKDSHSLTRVYR